MQRFVLALVTLLAALIGAPASAAMVLTPFASFNTLPGGTFYWQNNAAYGGPGSGGQLFTTTTPATPIPNAIPVNFNWAAAGFNNVAATLIFRGIAINSPVVTTGLPGAVANQTGIGFGSFLIAVGPTTVLLGTYNSGTIITNIGATNALFLTNSFPGGLNITSPVAPVPPGFFLTINKTGLTPPIAIAPGGALADFDPAAVGVFSSVSFVPEPAMWALSIAGFGLTGLTLRRRRMRITVCA